MKPVSVVILNWNGKDYLEQFLPGLIRHTPSGIAEIVVADNASTDDSVRFLEDRYPSIRLIRLEENHGFAGGYNRALARLDSPYYLLLNSDIEVTPGWLDPLLDHMESHPQCAACGPKIRDYHRRSHFEYAGAAGGYIDRYGYAFCRGRIFDHLEEDRGQYDDVREVFWSSGACMLVRAELFRSAGGFDEAFFAHMEEIDLCWRLGKMGHPVYCIPASVVYHVGGGTLARGNPRKTYLNFRNNLLLLYKNTPAGPRRQILFRRMLLDAVSALRFLLSGAWADFLAVLRAHRAYYGMKSGYKGTGHGNNSGRNGVIAKQIYPGSIVFDFFLRGRKEYGSLRWKR